MSNTPRLAKLLALAAVITAIIDSSGLVSAIDATNPSPSGSASASAASTPASTAEDNSQRQPQSQTVMIEPAEGAPGALTSQNTLRDGAITSVDIAPPQAIPTQPNPSQPVFTITNTDTEAVTIWVTDEGFSADTSVSADANETSSSQSASSAIDLQYRDAETGERLSGADVTVTVEPGEERVVGVVASDSASTSASASSTLTATVHVRQTGATDES
ncbi:hypothetical protein [Haloquadratum walsbyi]|uniref:Uncharacterized protein n=1 Tax=Haloquadratum walsbyi J07HQW2 TaxID=1238425 RepID=U1MUY3_9EURY|nr:hypothetical protein [Haloquadratum walsbyi]ERG94204.1 MAG: hypothetical protein J07HQW2_00638 [Haloquadratum walsbyi J07HQW2]